MPILVHLADERDSASIKQNGIKLGKGRSGIYCMPVTQNFYVTHQWLRELKRGGAKNLVGIYFRLPASEKVFAGRFNQPHNHIDLGAAIREIQSIADPLGYELIIDRKILPIEIIRIKYLSQAIGWRYQPYSNSHKPCGCEYCQRGGIKSVRIKEKYNPLNKLYSYGEILDKLKIESNEDETVCLLQDMMRKPRKDDPNNLLFLLDKNSVEIDRYVALVMEKFRHKNTKDILSILLTRSDHETREYAAYSLLKLYREKAEKMFSITDDSAINTALTEWRQAK